MRQRVAGAAVYTAPGAWNTHSMTTSQIGICSWSLRPDSPRRLVESLKRVEIGAVQLALLPVVTDPGVWGSVFDELGTAGIVVLSGMMTMEGEDYSTLESIRETGGLRPDATWPTNRWIGAMIRLFRPQIRWLVEERDAAVAVWQAGNPDSVVYEDHGFEVPSVMDISVENQIRRVREAKG